MTRVPTSHDPRQCGTARALLVTEQAVLIEAVRAALRHGPYATRVAYNVEEAAAMLDGWRPQLTMLDLDGAGRAVLERIGHVASHAVRLPSIALTRRRDLQTKLAAFEHGADDIVTVPFTPEEFAARVLALMRRTYRDAAAFTPVLRIGELEIDIPRHHVRAGGIDLHLTSLEQTLLYVLAINAGRLLTRDELLDHIWGSDYVAESNVIDRHIRNLRAKLQDDCRKPRYIFTVPGRGYRFMRVAQEARVPTSC